MALSDGPNLLWIVFDTARADALEPYGAPAGATPAVAQLAARGVAVQDVFATACWTLPSHVSMFSGALPRAVGLGDVPNPPAARPAYEALADRLLPEFLRRAGFETRAASTNLWVSRSGGFATGFEEFRELYGDRQERMSGGGRRGRLRWALEALRARVDDGAREAEAVLREWIAGHSGSRFFWFVNLVECHSPYLPPRPYDDLPALERVRAAEDARRHLHLEAIWRTCVGEFDVPEPALERMRHLYAASIRYMDDWLARVLDALDRRGILGDTLVVVSSDHGENFGEGGLLAHALSLDDRLIRAPLVVAGPGRERLTGVRSLAQMPAALSGALGLDAHPWPEDALPASAALAQFQPSIGPDDPRLRESIERWGLGEAAAERFTTPLLAATDGRTKLLRRGERLEAYDLATDPLELNPRTPGPEFEAPESLLAALEHPAARIAEMAPSAPAGVDPDELASLEDRMRLLGYM